MVEGKPTDPDALENPIDDYWFSYTQNVSLPKVKQTGESDGYSSTMYFWDDHNVITKNLQYILHKRDKHWYLLFNPLHRSDFLQYYQSWAKDVDYDLLKKSWGTNTNLKGQKSDMSGKTGYIPFEQLFKNYCHTFKVKAKGYERFLDPTCNLFVDRSNCAFGAFFRENRADYVSALPGTTPEIRRKLLEQFLQDSDDGKPSCLCEGALRLGAQNFVQTDSFVDDWLKTSTCQISSTTINCSNIISSNANVVLEGAELDNQCGGPQAEPPYEEPAAEEEAPAEEEEDAGAPAPPAPPDESIDPNIIVAGAVGAVLCVGVAAFALRKRPQPSSAWAWRPSR